jgi:hypothetical protein
MAEPLTPGAFYDSARDFARTALEAHHAQDYSRMAVDAGTALEHLVKACLATRSSALLVELKGEADFQSPGPKPAGPERPGDDPAQGHHDRHHVAGRHAREAGRQLAGLACALLP